jgi:hypothetical protein
MTQTVADDVTAPFNSTTEARGANCLSLRHDSNHYPSTLFEPLIFPKPPQNSVVLLNAGELDPWISILPHSTSPSLKKLTLLLGQTPWHGLKTQPLSAFTVRGCTRGRSTQVPILGGGLRVCVCVCVCVYVCMCVYV